MITLVNGLIANVNGQFDFLFVVMMRDTERGRETLLAYDYLHMPMMTNFASV